VKEFDDKFKELAKPFLEWLRSAGQEDEEEEETV